jgi:hypothetical protein
MSTGCRSGQRPGRWLARPPDRSETTFGVQADTLADAASRSGFVLNHEPSHRVRAAVLATWAASVAAVTVASIWRGRMLNPSRPVLPRPAATMEAVVAVRAWRDPARTCLGLSPVIGRP